jgi:hypothetical protein
VRPEDEFSLFPREHEQVPHRLPRDAQAHARPRRFTTEQAFFEGDGIHTQQGCLQWRSVISLERTCDAARRQ